MTSGFVSLVVSGNCVTCDGWWIAVVKIGDCVADLSDILCHIVLDVMVVT